MKYLLLILSLLFIGCSTYKEPIFKDPMGSINIDFNVKIPEVPISEIKNEVDFKRIPIIIAQTITGGGGGGFNFGPAGSICNDASLSGSINIEKSSTPIDPAVAIVNASSILSSGYTNDFETLKFEWDCGLANAGKSVGTWNVSLMSQYANAGSMDYGYGGVYACYYPEPGTYTITLRATSPDELCKDFTTSSFVVNDKDTQIGSALTWCLSETGAFTGCPLDTTPGGSCEVQPTHCITDTTSDNFNDLILNTINAGCAGSDDSITCSGSQKAAIYLEAGRTFDSNSTYTLFPSSSPGYIGRYGAGNDPVIDIDGTTFFVLTSGWVFEDVDFISQTATDRILSLRSVVGTNYIVLDGVDLTLDISDTGIGGQGAQTGQQRGMALVNFTTNFIAPATGNIAMSGFGSDYALLGASINYPLTTQRQLTGMRTEGSSRSVVAHSKFVFGDTQNSTQALRHARACGSSCTAGQIDVEYTSVFANEFQFQPSGGNNLLRYCSTGDCTSNGPVASRHHLIEGNYFHTVDGTLIQNSISSGIVQLGGGTALNCVADVVVRNNIFDLMGAELTGNINIVSAFSCTDDTAQPNDNPKVLNNAVFVSSGTNADVGLLSISGSSVTGAEVRNNVFYHSGANTKTLEECGGTGIGCTASNNIKVTSNPFAEASFSQGNNVPADFQILTGSTAVKDVGYTVSGDTDISVMIDAFMNCRPFNTNWDIGPHEFGASTCFPSF